MKVVHFISYLVITRDSALPPLVSQFEACSSIVFLLFLQFFIFHNVLPDPYQYTPLLFSNLFVFFFRRSPGGDHITNLRRTSPRWTVDDAVLCRSDSRNQWRTEGRQFMKPKALRFCFLFTLSLLWFLCQVLDCFLFLLVKYINT